ncbi:MAG: anhydro-N-acetylmuramic acid kinase, partial [Cyanobacteriota bacterium]
MWVLGLMSGTSADWVDAVLARFWGSATHPRWQVARSAYHPNPPARKRARIRYGPGYPLPAAAVLDQV